MTYAYAKFEVASSSSFRGDAFTRKYSFDLLTLILGVNVTLNVAQYPLHNVTYAAAKFEVATSNGLGEDAFTRKFIIWPWSRSHEMLSNPLHHVIYAHAKFEVATTNSLRGNAFTKIQYLTF